MEIIYTEHAEENITERKLEKEIIEDILRNPDQVISSRFGRQIAQRTVNGKLLRVIYEQQSNIYIVVTAYFTGTERYRRNYENNI